MKQILFRHYEIDISGYSLLIDMSVAVLPMKMEFIEDERDHLRGYI